MFDSDKMAVNKLIILYILDSIEMPLSKTQLNSIILENNYIDYFSLQQCLPELEQSDLIKQIESQKQISYEISPQGKKTLKIFTSKIPERTRKLIDSYVLVNRENIKQEAQIMADFTKVGENEYIVNLKVIEKNIVLIDLKLSVVSSKQAKLICEKWKNSSEKIYSQIMNTFIN